MAITPCTVKDTIETRQQQYVDVRRRLHPLLTGETDLIAAMATVVCELHHSFAYYNWTGFYRASGDGALVVGPYQGSHGCLRISPGNGVCGAAAAAKKTQLVPDVHVFPGHIACSSSSNSEVRGGCMSRQCIVVRCTHRCKHWFIFSRVFTAAERKGTREAH
mmetsp:Transcript_32558/g.58280  ORF Transcript_32558/g.58280 Transcript_32558/m.58280 type:complete len:162 (+) Transcript_32558:362-847(+)